MIWNHVRLNSLDNRIYVRCNVSCIDPGLRPVGSPPINLGGQLQGRHILTYNRWPLKKGIKMVCFVLI